MKKVDTWLTDNINNLYSLENEQQYLDAVEVRGHRFILKDRAKKYLMDEAEKVLLNKKFRKRVK